VVVAATHGLLVGTALTRLRQLAVRRLLVTDTVEPVGSETVEACSVSGLLAEAIGRLHAAKRLDDLEAFG
jgi:ribose-phosphate pyrophosphokinase